MNKVFLSGRIAKIYDIKIGNKGTSVVTFNLKAYNDVQRKSFTVLECVVFGESAVHFNNNVKEKDYIEVEGKINKTSYKDKNNNTVFRTNITVTNFEVVNRDNISSRSNDMEIPEVEGVKSADDFDALASLGITNTDSYDDDVPF